MTEFTDKALSKYRDLEVPPESRCRVCFALEHLFSGGQKAFQFEFEAFTCKSHVSMLNWIKTSFNEWIDEMPNSKSYRRKYYATGVGLYLSKDGMPEFHVLDYKKRPTKSYSLLMRKPCDLSPEEITMNPSWINFSVATMWKERCINQHGPKCQESDKTAFTIPDWLVDTKEDCIVSGDASMEFVALSYRWGTSPGSEINFTMWDELQKPGGLSSFIAMIPIIRDATHVVRSINERYLWVDTICIRHDDEIHLAHQLQHMGAIYASAKLAIIASDGDGMTGLPGIQGYSPPRNLTNIFPWDENGVILIRDLPVLGGSVHHQSDYFRRGWTFQEYVLSRRRLIFGRQQIHWVCGCATWHEDLPHTDAQLHEPHGEVLQFPNTLRRRPKFQELSRLLRAYNRLEMTYPEDALPGIAGLLRLIAPSFHGGFLFGLPIACFEAALLWHGGFWHNVINRLGEEAIRRRKRSVRCHSILPDSELPSWSWIGWKGDHLNLLKDEEDYRVVTHPSGSTQGSYSRSEKWITIPTTQWYCHDTPGSTVKRRICSSWFEPYQDTSYPQNLPEGWIREKYPGTKGPDIADMRSLPYGISGDYIYRHQEFPGSSFWRPFPVSHASNMPMEQSKFISCKTKRSWFRCVRENDYAPGTGMDYHLKLLDMHNQICGWVQLPEENEALPDLKRRNFTESNSTKAADGVISDNLVEDYEYVELVVVCQRLFSESISHESGWRWLDKRTYKHYYGVLCIEWEDGIAYRKGCGLVKKDLWDQHDIEDVDLILG